MKTGSKLTLLGLLMLGMMAGSAWAKVDSKGDGAWMGVYTESVDYQMAERTDLPIEYGALITDVVSNSPAEKAGLKENDIIVAIEGTKITDSDELADAVAKAHPGDKVEVKIYRDGKPMTLAMTLGASSDSEEQIETPAIRKAFRSYSLNRAGKQSYIGVNLTPLTDQLREYFGVPKDEGVLIGTVEKDSPADHAGLKAGDILIAVDGRKVTSVGDVQSQIHDVKAGDKANLTVVRNKSEMKLPVEVAEREGTDVLAEEFNQAMPEPPDVPGMQNLRNRMYIYGDRGAEKSFNSEEFQKQMDELREQLKSLRTEVFDSESFQKEMEQLKEQLKSLDLTVRDLEKKVK
jgi:C-terminal processing protease CtpA/Prc